MVQYDNFVTLNMAVTTYGRNSIHHPANQSTISQRCRTLYNHLDARGQGCTVSISALCTHPFKQCCFPFYSYCVCFNLFTANLVHIMIDKACGSRFAKSLPCFVIMTGTSRAFVHTGHWIYSCRSWWFDTRSQPFALFIYRPEIRCDQSVDLFYW